MLLTWLRLFSGRMCCYKYSIRCHYANTIIYELYPAIDGDLAFNLDFTDSCTTSTSHFKLDHHTTSKHIHTQQSDMFIRFQIMSSITWRRVLLNRPSLWTRLLSRNESDRKLLSASETNVRKCYEQSTRYLSNRILRLQCLLSRWLLSSWKRL